MCPTACGSNTMRRPGCRPKYCLMRIVMFQVFGGAVPPAQVAQETGARKTTPRAGDVVDDVELRRSGLARADGEDVFQCLQPRDQRRLALRTRRLPATATTPGSSKWRVALRTMSLSKRCRRPVPSPPRPWQCTGPHSATTRVPALPLGQHHQAAALGAPPAATARARRAAWAVL